MQRVIRTLETSLVALVFMFVSGINSANASVQAVQTFEQNAWSYTTYYWASLQNAKVHGGAGGAYTGDITVRITAVNRYTLYINGTLIGSGDGWETVDTYTVPVVHLPARSSVVVGVIVENDGIGQGNGLKVDIDVDGEWMGTSLLHRGWDGGSIAYATKWFHATSPQAEAHVISGAATIPGATRALWKDVQPGTMGQLATPMDERAVVICGYIGDVDANVTGGGLILRNLEGFNLAAYKPSDYTDKLTDKDLSPASVYVAPLNRQIIIDLGSMYRVNKVVVYTGGTSPAFWDRRSPRGFQVGLGWDQFSFRNVGILHEIGEHDYFQHERAELEFQTEWARYVRTHITEIRPIDSVNLTQIMVYGEGYAYEGSYVSPWLDLGDSTVVKNFVNLEWEGDLPRGTEISVQTQTSYRTGATLVTSQWSNENNSKSFKFESPAPATQFRYRVNMRTTDVRRTPRFDGLRVSYTQDASLPLLNASGFVTPNSVPMGEASDFVYTMSYELQPGSSATGQNIATLALAVPGFSTLTSVYSTALNTLFVPGNGVDAVSRIDTLYVNFDTPIAHADTASLIVSFNSKLSKTVHSFDMFAFNSTGNDGSGGIKIWENRASGSKLAVASTITSDVLTNARAVPKAFTPDGDGINDFTVIEFSLSRMAEINTNVSIYTSRGAFVRTLHDGPLAAADWFVPEPKAGRAAEAETMPGYWDGNDQDGNRVPPGVYIWRVEISTGQGDSVESGTVVVAY